MKVRVLVLAMCGTALFAQTPQFQRDQIVRLIPNLQHQAGGIQNVRVVAIAGDRLYIDMTSMIVNGTPVAGLNPEFTNGMPPDQQAIEQVVPGGHIVVVGELTEQLRDGRVHKGRYWALTAATNVTVIPINQQIP